MQQIFPSSSPKPGATRLSDAFSDRDYVEPGPLSRGMMASLVAPSGEYSYASSGSSSSNGNTSCVPLLFWPSSAPASAAVSSAPLLHPSSTSFLASNSSTLADGHSPGDLPRNFALRKRRFNDDDDDHNYQMHGTDGGDGGDGDDHNCYGEMAPRKRVALASDDEDKVFGADSGWRPTHLAAANRETLGQCDAGNSSSFILDDQGQALPAPWPHSLSASSAVLLESSSLELPQPGYIVESVGQTALRTLDPTQAQAVSEIAETSASQHDQQLQQPRLVLSTTSDSHSQTAPLEPFQLPAGFALGEGDSAALSNSSYSSINKLLGQLHLSRKSTLR
ncbi:hypothetical protein CAOG_06657 [Capsaspora owczarzaki ATCC 30864]|uniref:Uncharacterized protein n=1 Tax=Capsaspora owczarzaki (strain ATCC 30864) TaxID=595528 RepID=A0A0D2WUG2_CAPO3|nr:hypothetical protein CAOG_06657 [Capsaspora owczarzaki ATCC 30864]KJE96315.1 hypothetical protein CAOG_006657 [Capsaspora owczarzaki ATCC 30864]|eukprot:XP_004344278.2 hypothetical protein CAOG_06657 [Capsaspora owczarzaki ATCC 30864]